MLFDTIEQVCLNYNSNEQLNKIQIILSKIFDTIHKAGSISNKAINIAIIDLVSKLLLSDKIKGIYSILMIFLALNYLIKNIANLYLYIHLYTI